MLKGLKERSLHLAKNKFKMMVYVVICVLLMIACVAAPTHMWITSGIEHRGITSIRGDSMTPTIYNNDILYVQPTRFERGEIVVAKCPGTEKYVSSKNVALLKRIVGLPGETVEITADGILINGVLLKEEYTITQDKTLSEDNDFNELILSDNEYFLLGDNRENSFDSRHVGAFHSTSFLYGLTTEPNSHTYSLWGKSALIAFSIALFYAISVISLLFLYTSDFNCGSKKKTRKQNHAISDKSAIASSMSLDKNANTYFNDQETKKSQPKSEKNKKKAERAKKAQQKCEINTKPKHKHKRKR